MDSELPVLPRRRRDDRATGRMRKGMYILPSLFTTANIAAGYYAILQVTPRGEASTLATAGPVLPPRRGLETEAREFSHGE